MTKHLRNLGEYNKALVAALGGAISVVLAILGLGGLLPDEVAGWLTAASASLTTASVYLVRNQELVDGIGDRAADLLDR